MGNKFYT